MHRKLSTMSDSWTCSRRSKRFVTLFNSQEFEKVDSLNTSFDTGRIKSVSLPDNIGGNMRREETYFEKIKNIGTNLKFKMEILGENIWHSDDRRKHKAYLLGKEYETEKPDDSKKMKTDFANIVWFSYRKNFPKLNYKLLPLSESFISDTGWGCMIRVCQMIFAECLKRNYIEKKGRTEAKHKKKITTERYELDPQEMKELNYKVVSWFLDTEIDPKESPYSIQNLSLYLLEKFKLEPGIWLKPSSVLFAFQEIHQDYGASTMPELQIEIYIESTLYVAQALKKVTYMDTSSDNSFDKAFADEFELVENSGELVDDVDDINEENIENLDENTPSTNERTRNELSSEQKEKEKEKENNNDDSLESIYLSDPREIEKLLMHKWKDSLLIFMLAKIGLDRPNLQYIPFIKDLLSYPESVGMIGGKPGLAYYIVGYIDDKLMYLDPHFVQESVQSKEELKENIDTYFTSTIKHVGFSDIDTSVTFGFYIKDEISFKAFLERLKCSCQSNESFLGVELNAPNEHTTDVESVCEDYGEENKVKDEDDFEMI